MFTKQARNRVPAAAALQPWMGTLPVVAVVAAALLVAPCGGASAQTKEPPPVPFGKAQLKGQTKEAPPAAQPPAAKQPPQAKTPLPPPEQMAILVQTAVVALSQANLTGNFSVLHAMGAPGFQQANPPPKLAEVFKNLREKSVDLTPIILFSPVLAREPVINEQGMLHLVGFYKTTPQQVNFELLFQPVSGQWRIFGISVRTVPAPTAAAQPPPAANAPAASPPAAAAPTPAKKTK